MSLTTVNGKEIAIVNAQGTGHCKIQFTTGGELPESLSGLYTSIKEAEKAVICYIERSKNKSTAKEKPAKEV